MYKKMDENTLVRILESGIKHFGECGLDRANINTIAAYAGVSVGVIYKYFSSKENFFLECVRYSLKPLDDMLESVPMEHLGPKEMIYRVIRSLQDHAREHTGVNVMYNEITSGSCRKYASVLASEIEAKSAKIYKTIIESADEIQENNEHPEFLAFFFDNLLMMLQFSYSCDYYKERMKLYIGEQEDDDAIANALTDFIYRGMFGGALNA